MNHTQEKKPKMGEFQDRFAVIGITIVLLSSPLSNSHAYLDPGSGSYLLQLIIAGLLGAGFMVKMYWGKITAFFKRKFTSGGAVEEDDE